MNTEPSQPGTILVVDDDPIVRSVASRLLRRYGYEVVEALNGVEALRLVRERDGGLDLLLTDLVMPELGGWELSERVRAEYPGVPVLFMSGYTEEESFLSGVERSQVRFLAKPFDLDTLIRSVREAIRPRLE